MVAILLIEKIHMEA
jgi:hypothetical protein